ncbi:transglutaminase-like domain-containing protein [Streptomyces sp. Je 1-4]|uniref:transglutaminase-like domain-containing protein n=1 Tax=Streptomyces TaxID=1883 RepID=UPI0021DA9672|nr:MULTISPECIES: transglutaminase-like domain-containing protein [unclassified Streptomyces]UYB40109.1 transglutaminase-like domain-containing protein [Streptomyces sp. Je 1-4]UZQ36199.1 transglutaminase-like domain-containing protein [Streptomyces sp. Je 1-4] [Streptomyces sp. Je 1-4 4N24]UZQ43617.1 transglutaminase-like domain-containing protein [Streptomyces sp. Je 1-4] [Streptomyces sp. Je 1-4 4N24_ara]
MPQEPEPEREDARAARRQQFAEAARAERPDLALLCLLIGAEADPALDEAGRDAAQIELDRLAGLLPYAPAGGPGAWARNLAELLGTRCGFAGSPADYRRLESSLLHEVLRRRRGLPILLSVVWMEVARRAGAPVYGVALPGHFVVGFGDPAGTHVLADPFAGGRPLTDEDAELLVAGATGEPLSAQTMTPADPLEIVLRMLNNIRAWAQARPEHSAVQLWALELSLLLPSHPARLRHERAQLLVQRGEFLAGAAELEEYARVVEAVEPAGATAIRRQAAAARAMLN